MEPDDWKPFDDIGPGTREIRIREASGAYRVMYVAKFEEAVYAIAETRYRAVVNTRKVGK